MALALYRKYRPRTFAEVIGQEHVTEPLSQALRSGRLHHAYLFSGPRGCGKTSSARILARSLNCEQGPTPEPCGVCGSCKSLANDGAGSIDVIEIDAASHGGVDDARELREKAFFAPANSRYKIYVIDEAHMVSSAGFNALLKLVEEPPDYVKFIFATTEPEKVLGTIRSRTHHYPFRLIPPAVLRPYLQQLTEAEGTHVDPAVFPLVVRAGGGSARDTLSVLDQLIAGAGPGGVDYARAVSLLGVTDGALIDEMCDALAAGDGAAAYQTIDRVAEAGHDPRRFASDLLERFRDLIVLQQVPDAVTKGLIDGPADQLDQMGAQATRLGPATLSRCADIVHNGLVEMRGTTAPRLLLELITARMLLPGADDSTGALLQRLERMERRLTLTSSDDSVRPEHPSPPHAAPAAPQAADPSVAASASAGPSVAGVGLSAARAAAAAARRGQAPVQPPAPAPDRPAGPAPAPAPDRPAGPAPAQVASATGVLPPGAAAAQPASAAPVAPPMPADSQPMDADLAAGGSRTQAPGSMSSAEPAAAPSATVPAASAVDEPGAPASLAQGPTSVPAAPTSAAPGAVAPASATPSAAAPVSASPGAAAPTSAAPGAAAPVSASPGAAASVSAASAAPATGPREEPAGLMPDAPEEPGGVLDAVPGQLTVASIREVWPQIMVAVGRKSKKIAALAQGATVRELEGQTVVLTFRFPAHARMVAAEPQLIADALYEELGGRWQIRCDVAGEGGSPPSSGGPAPRGPQGGGPAPRGPQPGGGPVSAGLQGGGGPVSAGPQPGGGPVSAGPQGGGGPVSAGPQPGGGPVSAGPQGGGGPVSAGPPPGSGPDVASSLVGGGPVSAGPQDAGAVQSRPSREMAPEQRIPARTEVPAGSMASARQTMPVPAEPSDEDDDGGWPEPVKPGDLAFTAPSPAHSGVPAAGSAADEHDDEWPEPARPGQSEEWPEPARPGQPAASATVSPQAGIAATTEPPASTRADEPAEPAAGAGEVPTRPKSEGAFGRVSSADPPVPEVRAGGSGTSAASPSGGEPAKTPISVGPPAATSSAAAGRAPSAGIAAARAAAARGAAPLAGRGAAPAAQRNAAAPAAPSSSTNSAQAGAAGNAAAKVRAGASGGSGPGLAGKNGNGGSSWSDGSPTEEAPYDPEYDGPPKGASWEGFDPGDEPLDDVIDEKTARQSSQQQAVQLLKDAFGAELISES
ncbi:DNA polymerase III subunit gamma and tau [Actinoplanes sp. NPDC051859]|uniref:DNA polymerase III subunit gamma and tau n=1 Tax=Actinoplanes sp. NPDC051859 TaxID=3363909 RepID=UPI0037874B83